jgi:transposase-like protein
MKKTHSAMLKFKVALAALTGHPIVEICRQYEVAESLVHKWKNQLKEGGAIVFGQNTKKLNEQHDIELAKLYQRIGQLTTEVDFLKKVVEA